MDINYEKNLVSYLTEREYPSLQPQEVERLKAVLLHDLVIGDWGYTSREFRAVEPLYTKEKFLDRVLLTALAFSARACEDFYGANHFGPLIIPNALLFGAEHKIGGDKLLQALAVGFEVGISLGDQLGAGAGARGFRGTPVFGIVAAAAAAAYASSAKHGEFARILAHAAANVFGLGSSLLGGTDEWRYQAALGAYHAAFAAHVGLKDLEGGEIYITGEKNLADVFVGQTELNPPQARFGLSLLKLGVKRHPVHIFALSPVEAAVRLAQSHGPFSDGETLGVKVRIPAKQVLPFNLQTGPYSIINQAIVSIPSNVAIALHHGKYEPELLSWANHPEVVQIALKVQIIPDSGLQEYEAELEVITTKGVYTEKVADPSELYFPTLAQERALLLKEAPIRGISPEKVSRLAGMIEHMEAGSCEEILAEI
ncbi:MAG: MmgE/PrpD family protein [Desulfitobacteriaceae bacterium]